MDLVDKKADPMQFALTNQEATEGAIPVKMKRKGKIISCTSSE
jgi:hypothetical protein